VEYWGLRHRLRRRQRHADGHGQIQHSHVEAPFTRRSDRAGPSFIATQEG
jgi:hypothetical protein